jgi:hypothetical protein
LFSVVFVVVVVLFFVVFFFAVFCFFCVEFFLKFLFVPGIIAEVGVGYAGAVDDDLLRRGD